MAGCTRPHFGIRGSDRAQHPCARQIMPPVSAAVQQYSAKVAAAQQAGARTRLCAAGNGGARACSTVCRCSSSGRAVAAGPAVSLMHLAEEEIDSQLAQGWKPEF